MKRVLTVVVSLLILLAGVVLRVSTENSFDGAQPTEGPLNSTVYDMDITSGHRAVNNTGLVN